MLNAAWHIWLKNCCHILQPSFDLQMGDLLCPGCYKQNLSYLRSGSELARWADLEGECWRRNALGTPWWAWWDLVRLPVGGAHTGAQAAEAHKWQGQLMVGRLAVGRGRGPVGRQWRTSGKPVANQWQTIGIFHWHIPFVLGNEDS